MMPLSVQLSIVAVAAAFVVLAIVTTRAMLRFDKAVERMVDRFARTSEGVNQALLEVAKVTAEAKEVVGALHETVPHVKRIVERVEHLGDRVVDMSSTVLDEVEKPVRVAVALVRGVRAGTTNILQLISRRLTNGGAPHKESYHE